MLSLGTKRQLVSLNIERILKTSMIIGTLVLSRMVGRFQLRPHECQTSNNLHSIWV